MLQGRQVQLRPPAERDVPVLWAIRNDIALQTELMAVARPNTEQSVRDWLARRTQGPDSILLVISDATGDATWGFIQLTDLDPHHGRGTLGICVHADARSQGAGEEAMTLLEDYAARTLNLRKITLSVLERNTGAIRFYERLGYRTVGVQEAHAVLGGEMLDVRLMEKLLLREDS